MKHPEKTCVLGVISDTHGTLLREAVVALAGVDLIVHAGDIDSADVLASLQDIAPVVAVRGNMDRGGWTKDLLRTQVVKVAGVRIYVIHDIHALDLDPAAAGFSVVISGHTHRPSIKQKDGVVYINPGSAWWPRSGEPPTLAIVRVRNGQVQPRLVHLGA
ncbi:MAG: metallophosphoesterase family protein [Deltaproteobacteria bacterium]|nr:metallophosphoesterase family protein [Deltaproteobacteria bacterium]